MRRISYSWNPTIYQISSISANLRKKFDKSFNVEIDCWTYDHKPIESGTEVTCQVSMVPGLKDAPCTIFYFSSWSELLSWYLKVMKEGLPSE